MQKKTRVSGKMNAYIALLRAVNVGGTGKLPMTELKAMCEAAGFLSVRTYIASGNVVFQSTKTEAQVKAALEAALSAYAGKPVGVMVRTAAEMAAVLAHNPFSKMPGNRTVAYFLDAKPSADALQTVTNQTSRTASTGCARNLRVLSRWPGRFEAENSRSEKWNGAQHEYHRQACRNGG